MVVPPGVAPLPVSTFMVARRNSPVATRVRGTAVQTGREQVLPVWLALCVLCAFTACTGGRVRKQVGQVYIQIMMDVCTFYILSS